MPFKNFLSHRYLEKVKEEESAIEYGEHLLRTASAMSSRTTRSRDSSQSVKETKSLREKLKALHLTERCHPEYPEFRANLLRRLMQREQLNSVILNLYPGDSGFTVEISGRECPSPPMLRYEDPLVESIDRGELHPSIVDLLTNAGVFYDGCVIVEVRDHRRSDPTRIESNTSKYNSNYVILKPTTQTLVADLSVLAPENNSEWSYDDRQRLESMLLVATSEPLCLDPSPSVAIVANRIQYYKNNLHRPSLKRMAKEHSQVTINKRMSLGDVPLPPYLQSYEYLSKRKKKFTKPVPSKVYFPCEVEFPKIDNYDFLLDGVIRKLPFSANVSSLPEEYREKYIFIKRNPGGSIQCTKIDVEELPEDRLFEVTPSWSPNKQVAFIRGPSFKLRSKESVIKYVDQFTETYTEKGTLTVKTNEESEQKVIHSSLAVIQPLASATSISSVIHTKDINNSFSNSGLGNSTSSSTAVSVQPVSSISAINLSLSPYAYLQGASESMVVSPNRDDSTESYQNNVQHDSVIFPGYGLSVINNSSSNSGLSNSSSSSTAVSVQPVSAISAINLSLSPYAYLRGASESMVVSPNRGDSTEQYQNPVQHDSVIFPGNRLSVINNSSSNSGLGNSASSSTADSAQPVSAISAVNLSRSPNAYLRGAANIDADMPSCSTNQR